MIVAALNGGSMPVADLVDLRTNPDSNQIAVFPFGYHALTYQPDHRHILMDSETRFWILGDFIVMNFGLVSIGDLLIVFAGFLSFLHLLSTYAF